MGATSNLHTTLACRSAQLASLFSQPFKRTALYVLFEICFSPRQESQRLISRILKFFAPPGCPFFPLLKRTIRIHSRLTSGGPSGQQPESAEFVRLHVVVVVGESNGKRIENRVSSSVKPLALKSTTGLT